MASTQQRYVQHYNKEWGDNFFVFIYNRTVWLLCGYQSSIIKKFMIEKYYKNKHFANCSRYVDEEKFNFKRGIKIKKGCRYHFRYQ